MGLIFGLSDLHLDQTKKKTMEIFGESWQFYEDKIFAHWKSTIHPDDLVLIPGDISWAMTLSDAIRDLERLDQLPGKKILLKGNHDYWWQSLNKLNSLPFSSLFFLQNNSFQYERYWIAGSRGWLTPDHPEFTIDDEKIFRREQLRLRMSLESIPDKEAEIVAMMHYPPVDKVGKPSLFVDILHEFNVKTCVYGHLHGLGLMNVFEGASEGLQFYCLSSDYLNFQPKRII